MTLDQFIQQAADDCVNARYHPKDIGMKTIDELIALLQQETEGAHLTAVEIIAEDTIDGIQVPIGREVELAAFHHGRSDAYRHALAQALHVQAALNDG